MYVTGVPLSDFQAIAARVSEQTYGGNVVVEDSAQVSKNRIRVKIGTLDSRAYGSRTTASGRHGRYASWHAFRDIFMAVFDAYPDATIRTGVAVYKGRDGFLATFPGTGDQNVGSLYQPVTFRSLSV